MAWKTIPFSLDVAKQIQEGKIRGVIKTKNGLVCKIVSYCDGTDFFVERITEQSSLHWCYPYTKDGFFIDGKFNGGTDYDLILEVKIIPEEKRAFINEHWNIESKMSPKDFRNRQAFIACAARDSFYFRQGETRGQDYRAGFLSGVEWADKHPSKETVHNIVDKVYEWFLEDPNNVMFPRLRECVNYVLTSNGV